MHKIKPYPPAPVCGFDSARHEFAYMIPSPGTTGREGVSRHFRPFEKRDPEKITDEEKEEIIRDMYETNFLVYSRLAQI